MCFFRCDPELGCVELKETSSQLETSSHTEYKNGNTLNYLQWEIYILGIREW